MIFGAAPEDGQKIVKTSFGPIRRLAQTDTQKIVKKLSKKGRCPSEDHLNTIFTHFVDNFTPKVEPTGQRRPKAAAALWVGGRRPPTTLGAKWF